MCIKESLRPRGYRISGLAKLSALSSFALGKSGEVRAGVGLARVNMKLSALSRDTRTSRMVSTWTMVGSAVEHKHFPVDSVDSVSKYLGLKVPEN